MSKKVVETLTSIVEVLKKYENSDPDAREAKKDAKKLGKDLDDFQASIAGELECDPGETIPG